MNGSEFSEESSSHACTCSQYHACTCTQFYFNIRSGCRPRTSDCTKINKSISRIDLSRRLLSENLSIVFPFACFHVRAAVYLFIFDLQFFVCPGSHSCPGLLSITQIRWWSPESSDQVYFSKSPGWSGLVMYWIILYTCLYTRVTQ